MVSIAGMEVNLGDYNWIGLMKNTFWGFFIFCIVGLVGFYLYTSLKKKTTYVYPVTLLMKKENGGYKQTTNLFGGKVTQRSGIQDFKIIKPRSMKKHSLGYVPDFSLAGADDRLTFITSGDATAWQQCKTELVETKEYIIKVQDPKDSKKLIDKKLTLKLLVEPIPTDIKTVTVNRMQAVKDIFDKNRLTAYGITIFGILIMVIAHLISLYIQTKLKCPVP